MTNMADRITKNQISLLKNEIVGKNKALEADKEMFALKLVDSLGLEILESLETKRKPSIWVGLIYKIKRFITIKKSERAIKKAIKTYGKRNDFENIEDSFYE